MKKIAVVDDEEGILQALELLLRQSGYEVRLFRSAENIVENISAEQPDLMLLDLRLSGVSGDEAAQLLKADPATKDVPIILMSAHPELPEVASKLSIEGFLPKPFDIAGLLSVIESNARGS
jgi:DNA-binding response OmpR family regulator